MEVARRCRGGSSVTSISTYEFWMDTSGYWSVEDA